MNKVLLMLFIFLLFSAPVFSKEDNQVSVQEISEQTVSQNNVAQDTGEILPYDFSSTMQIPIKVSITEAISTKDGLIEGSRYDFKVLDDVYYNNQLILKKGSIIPGRLETVVTSGMNGFPAEIMLDDFEIPGVKPSQIMGFYVKKGQNRCFWVYPLKWALTIIPFVGSLTNLIMGGHARVKTSDVITLYYYPEWK